MKNIDQYFPEHLGVIKEITKISVGLSGSAVYSVSTDQGPFVMRIHKSGNGNWEQLLTAQELASLHKITPKIHYVDKKEFVVVSTKIKGQHFGQAIRNPSSAARVFQGLIENLQQLHELPVENFIEVDPINIIKNIWQIQSARLGFPEWCSGIKTRIEILDSILKTDQRKVVSHNDLNPSNILWDDTRVWLIDWEIAGLNHPYYDLASIATFLNLPDEMAFELLAAQEKTVIDLNQKNIFKACLELTSIVYGTLILSLVPDLNIYPYKTLESTFTLPQVYEKISKGELDLQTSHGQVFLSMAMLKNAVTKAGNLV